MGYNKQNLKEDSSVSIRGEMKYVDEQTIFELHPDEPSIEFMKE